MGSHTRISTHSVGIPNTFPHGMEYFPPVWNIFPTYSQHFSPRYGIRKSLDISSCYSNNDRLERYEQQPKALN